MSKATSRYRTRMVLQNFTVTRDAVKQPVKTWFDEVEFWGEIDFAYKGEEMLGGHRESETPLLVSLSQVWIFTRYRRDVLFSPQKRIVADGRIFEIVAWYDATNRKRRLQILVQEVQT